MIPTQASCALLFMLMLAQSQAAIYSKFWSGANEVVDATDRAPPNPPDQTPPWPLGLFYGLNNKGQSKSRSEAGNSVSSTALSVSNSGGVWPAMHDSFRGVAQALGRKVPLRGFASIATDLGLPGAQTLISILTPKSQRVTDVAMDRSDAPKIGSLFALLREELLALVGSFYGEQRCLERMACLFGQHLAVWNGAPTITMIVSVASDRLPFGWQTAYTAFKDAMMYSEGCAKYVCHHETEKS